jgi:hypothetical protein
MGTRTMSLLAMALVCVVVMTGGAEAVYRRVGATRRFKLGMWGSSNLIGWLQENPVIYEGDALGAGCCAHL